MSWLLRRQFSVTVYQVQLHGNIRHDVRTFVAAHPLGLGDDLEVGRRRQRVRDICRGTEAWEAWDRLNSFHSVMAWQAADDDTAELVEVYAEGYTGEGAARAAGLDQARHHAAMVQLARAVAACDHVLDHPHATAAAPRR